MIKFKDVAHLYLGCRLKCIGGKFIPNKNSTDKDGKLILSTSLMCDFEDRIFSIHDFKPILRPLPDMTELEHLIEVNVRKNKSNDYIRDAARTAYLLSRGFDLFGLIENGEAITLTNTNN